MLMTLITRKERKHALFQMQPDKSPRSDGFNLVFYHYSYIISIYVLHNSMVHDIKRMINTYWSGGGGNN